MRGLTAVNIYYFESCPDLFTNKKRAEKRGEERAEKRGEKRARRSEIESPIPVTES
jgi:hypothetical protein